MRQRVANQRRCVIGTNYYRIPPRCEHCGRGDEREHVGKSSAGWSFSFHTDLGLPRSFAEWKERLRGEVIENEYGDRVTLEEFTAMVERKQGGRRHAEEYPTSRYPGHPTFLDPEGHSFSEGEFS